MFKQRFPQRDKMPVYHYPLALRPANDFIRAGNHLNNIGPDRRKGHNLYIHIPFCEKFCSFCPFVKSLKNDQLIENYLKALDVEMKLYSKTNYVKNLNFTAVYFGGGTPSILSIEQLINLLKKIRSLFNISSDAEITIEGSPSSLGLKKLQALKKAGVNRISMGVQTFDNKLGEILELPQESATSKKAIRNALETFDTVSIDLIYNIPGQSLDLFKNDLKQSIDLGINQITLFPMAIVPFTKLFKFIKEGQAVEIQPDEKEHEFYQTAMDFLAQKGFSQKTNYDWTKPEAEFKYSTQHFKEFSNILGVGAGAFGEIDNVVYVNTGLLPIYQNATGKGLFPVNVWEQLDGEEMHKFMAMGIKGLTLSDQIFKSKFNKSMFDI